MTSTPNFKTNRTLSIILSFVLSATIFSSCKKNDDQPTPVAAVAVTNASSVAQDVYFDNQKATASALLSSQTVGYFSVANSPIITFQTAGTSTSNGSIATSFSPGRYYNVFYTEDKTVLIYENSRTPPSPGKARIRFVNLSTGIGSSADFGLAGGVKIVSGLAYKTISDYQEVDPASAYSLYTGGSTSVLLSIPISLTAGGIYTLYITGTSSTDVSFKLIGEN